jgi:amino acid adenylation domain-containing protein
VAARHSALRTRYPERDGRPVAVVDATPAVELAVERTEDLSAALRSEAKRPFDLAVDHPIRFRLWRTGPEEHVLALTAHHIAIDGWSLALLLADLATEYRRRLGEGDPVPPPPQPALDFRDFAVAQRDRLTGPEAEQLTAYWQGALEGAPQLLALPTDRPRPPRLGDGAARHSFTLPAELAERLHQVAARAGATPFVLLLAAYQLLLHRYSGQDDLLVGVPVAGRLHEEAESVLGDFVNTLALRARFRPGDSFGDLLTQLRGVVLDAFDHQELPFDRVVDALAPRRDLSHPPLVQTLFAFQNTPALGFQLPGVTSTPLPSAPGSQLDLSLAMAEQDGTLAGVFEYRTELFDAETVDGLARAFTRLLTDVCADPEQPYETARLLDPEEERTLLALAVGPAPLAPPTTLTALLAERVTATPDAVAVLADQPDGGVAQLTWAELDARADRIARALHRAGVRRGDLVGVHARRTTALPAALLGVLKAGAGYVPLDPDHPAARLTTIIRTAGLRTVLTQRGLEPVESDAQWLPVDGELPTGPPAELPLVGPEDAAYVLFTSGSTGTPKGVVVTHGNVTSYLQWFQSLFRSTTADRLLQHTAYGFDVSVPELFGGLLGGAATVLVDPAAQADARATLELVRRHGVSYVGGVPSYLRLLAEDGGLAACPSIRLLLSCGEALPMELAASLRRQSGAVLENQYGPTETTVTMTRCRMDQAEPVGGIAPLGTPAPATRAYLLDARLRPVPPGVTGELYLAGRHLARGYLGDPARTARAFLPDPFTADPGARMYRSGDLGRQLRDGTLEFQGRADRQTKLRGFRVELGEVEAVLAAHPAVSVAAVLLDGQGERARLVGHAAPRPDQALDEAELRAFCAERLPGYLVPALVRVLDQLPLNTNGKVDHRALAAQYPPGSTDQPDPATAEAAPEGPTEQLVSAAWAEVLGRTEPIGRDQDFFALGGNSLLAARLTARLRRDLGVDLPVRTVFRSNTVRTLAAAADEAVLAALDGTELARLVAELDATTDPTTEGLGHDAH